MLRHLLIATAAFAALGLTWAVVLLLARRTLHIPPEQDLPACGSCARGPCVCADRSALENCEMRAHAGTDR